MARKPDRRPFDERDIDTVRIIQSLASLCDAMKRLELAIASDAPDDRAYYLSECAARRKRVEQTIMEKLNVPETGPGGDG